MRLSFPEIFDAIVTALVLGSQVYVYELARRRLERALSRRWAIVARLLLAAWLLGALSVGWMNSEGRIWGHGFGSRWLSFWAGIWIMGSVGAASILFATSRWRKAPAARHGAGTSRREFLRDAARTTAALVPFGVAGYGTLLVRSNFGLRETDFRVPNLPPDLEGLRVALLSDIHFGPYLSIPELERVVAMANETKPHLTLVTGDLITHVSDPLETCLEKLARLRAEAGVFGCLGNHEVYAKCQNFTEQRGRSLGIDFLRQRRQVIQFGQARLNLVGVDYQRFHRPYLVGARRLVEPGVVNLLMSHNPDVFPVAADLGYDLVVGGHTHGGQVTVEIVEQTLNVGRFFTPFVAGLYRRGASSLYVSRGIGTINLPMRLGARPEVSLLRLRRA